MYYEKRNNRDWYVSYAIALVVAGFISVLIIAGLFDRLLIQ